MFFNNVFYRLIMKSDNMIDIIEYVSIVIIFEIIRIFFMSF